jgi:hypothetical protein
LFGGSGDAEATMARRWWFVVGGLVAVPLLAVGYDRLQTRHWVGHTDLQVDFLVTDARTGQPVAGAKVAVHPDGGFYRDRDEPAFVLMTGGDGAARRVCHDSMCAATQSGLRFTDTYAVHLPWWYFRVSAQGFEASDIVFLDAPEFARQVRRVGPRAAELVVQVSLRKRTAEPRGAPDRAGDK